MRKYFRKISLKLQIYRIERQLDIIQQDIRFIEDYHIYDKFISELEHRLFDLQLELYWLVPYNELAF